MIRCITFCVGIDDGLDGFDVEFTMRVMRCVAFCIGFDGSKGIEW